MKVKVYWKSLSNDVIDLEEIFGVTDEEFDNMSEEEQETLEQEIVDFLRDEIVLQVTSVEYDRI